jgi:uncharacterized protein (TIGR02145 family)
MLENLRYVPDAEDGYSNYTHSALESATNKYYAYPGADGSYDPVLAESDWDKSWGILYNWAGATNGRSTLANEGNTDYGGTYTQEQGICPPGWHLPSDMEWSDLEEVIAGPGDWDDSYRTDNTWRSWSYGKKMKSTTAGGSSKSAAEGGFDALLVGRVYSGSRDALRFATFFWSGSSYSGGTEAWRRNLASGDPGVNRTHCNRSYLFSVRCKKD